MAPTCLRLQKDSLPHSLAIRKYALSYFSCFRSFIRYFPLIPKLFPFLNVLDPIAAALWITFTKVSELFIENIRERGIKNISLSRLRLPTTHSILKGQALPRKRCNQHWYCNEQNNNRH